MVGRACTSDLQSPVILGWDQNLEEVTCHFLALIRDFFVSRAQSLQFGLEGAGCPEKGTGLLQWLLCVLRGPEDLEGPRGTQLTSSSAGPPRGPANELQLEPAGKTPEVEFLFLQHLSFLE